MNNEKEIIDYLKSISDEKYKNFSKKITPGDFEMLGVRIPILKNFIKKITEKEKTLILESNSQIFEITMLKGLIIANTKDLECYKASFEKFYPEINNWAICDTFLSASKIIKKDTFYFFNKAKQLLNENDEFKNRISFVILLNYFIEEKFIKEIFELIKDYKSDKYYANMALAWLISALFIKFPSETKEFLQNNNLDKAVIKMAERKIKDSYRVLNEDKEWIKKTINFS